MLKVTCQLNLTVDVPIAELVEQIAHEVHGRPSGVARELLLQRLKLYASGWKATDNEMLSLLCSVVSLDEGTRTKLTKWIEKNG